MPTGGRSGARILRLPSAALTNHDQSAHPAVRDRHAAAKRCFALVLRRSDPQRAGFEWRDVHPTHYGLILPDRDVTQPRRVIRRAQPGRPLISSFDRSPRDAPVAPATRIVGRREPRIRRPQQGPPSLRGTLESREYSVSPGALVKLAVRPCAGHPGSALI